MLDMDLSVCFGARFRRLSRVVSGAYNEALKPFELQISQVNILFAVSMNPGIYQADIGDYLFLQRSTLSREVARLIKLKLINSIVEKGSRSAKLTLTVEGEELVKRVRDIWVEVQSDLEEKLGKETLYEFEKLESVILSSN